MIIAHRFIGGIKIVRNFEVPEDECTTLQPSLRDSLDRVPFVPPMKLVGYCQLSLPGQNCAPEGHYDNSPPIHRWEQNRREILESGGTNARHCNRPSGTLWIVCPLFPPMKLVGYCHCPYRDKTAPGGAS